MEPNYSKSKLSLYFDLGGNGFNIRLSIEAIPDQYIEEEKQIILSEAKDGIGVGCLYDYDTWVDIIASANAWLKASKKKRGMVWKIPYPFQQSRITSYY